MQEAEKKAAATRECPLCSFSGPSLPFDEEEGDYDEDFDKKQKYMPIQHIQKKDKDIKFIQDKLTQTNGKKILLLKILT